MLKTSKCLDFTPSSLYEVALEFDDDYVTDPDQTRDFLPQPFRMIDKVLNKLLYDTWEIIASKEKKILAEAAKLKYPKYQCGIQLQDYKNVQSACSTPDGFFLFIGCTDGIVVVNATDQCRITSWQGNNDIIRSLQATSFHNDSSYLIAAIDDTGLLRLFSFTNGLLFQLTVLNQRDSDRRPFATKCDLAPGANYLGVSFKDKEDIWVDVYRTPKEAWIKELEIQVNKALKRTNQQNVQFARPVTDSINEGSANMELSIDNTTAITDAAVNNNEVDRPLYKFSESALILRIRQPQTNVSGVNWNTPHQLLKSVDGNCDTIQQGHNHFLSEQHIQQKTAFSQRLHNVHGDNKQMTKVIKLEAGEATLHFLPSVRQFSSSNVRIASEQAQIPGEHLPIVTNVSIWWSNLPQLMNFSLIKAIKDIERKADNVCPLSSTIVCSTVSRCLSLMALALDNNNILIWDVVYGLVKRVVHMACESPIRSVEFLNPILYPRNDTYTPYKTSDVGCYLLVTHNDGQTFLILSSDNEEYRPIELQFGNGSQTEFRTDSDNDIPQVFLPFWDIPEIVLTCRQSGRIFLHNLLADGRVLCEIALPLGYQLETPWQPILTLAANGQFLFMCVLEEDADSASNVHPNNSLILYQLRSFPCLDEFRSIPRQQISTSIQCTVDDRRNAIFRERSSRQAARKQRLENRWPQLKDELALIGKLRCSGNSHITLGIL